MITSKDIAEYLQLQLVGENIVIERYSQLSDPQRNSIVFAKKYSDEFVAKLNEDKDLLAIVTQEYNRRIRCSYIVSNNPRLDYIKVLSYFFTQKRVGGFVHPTATIEKGAIIGKDVYVGPGCYVSSQCIVGDGCVLHPNVVLDNCVILGKNCEIKSGAVLGQEGFGFERNADGLPIHFPHFGNVVVGENVFIGSNTTVERATLGSTIIEDNVKIDDLVQIGHNSHIGNGAMLTVGSIVCGGAELRPQCYMAPNSSVKEKVIIGRRALVGLGSVVLNDVSDDTVVVGVPAKVLCNKK